MTGPASKSHEPSLAAACPGPAPATGAEDRDPMHAPPSVALPTDAAIEGFIAVRPPVLASRERAPSVPPPRA
jgi:hypothetical protein